MKLVEMLVMGDYGRKENITIDTLDEEEIKLVLDLMEEFTYEQGGSTGVYEDDTNSGRNMKGLINSVIETYEDNYEDEEDDNYEDLFKEDEIEKLKKLVEIEVHSFDIKHNKKTDKLDIEIRCYG